MAIVHSTTGSVAIRNCPDLSNFSDIDVTSNLLVSCSSSIVGDYCDAEYCTDLPAGGIGCYCYPDSVRTDPNLGSCASSAQIDVPERELTILVTKPNIAKANFIFVNKGDNDLTYALQLLRSAALLWGGRHARCRHTFTGR